MDIPDVLAKHYQLACEDLDLRVKYGNGCFVTKDATTAQQAAYIRQRGDDYRASRLHGSLMDVARTWFNQRSDEMQLQHWSLRAHALKTNKTFWKPGLLDDAIMWEDYFKKKVANANDQAYSLLTLCSALHPSMSSIAHLVGKTTITLWPSAPAPSAITTETGSQDSLPKPTLRRKRKVITDD